MINADTNSGLPIRKEVAKHISELLGTDTNGTIGNPSQLFNSYSRDLIEKARKQVSILIDAKPEEIIFTSGATESCYLAILGSFLANKKDFSSIASATEHSAVTQVYESLKQVSEVEHKEITANRNGELDFSNTKNSKPTLLSLMSANNETGVKFKLEEVREKIGPKILFSDVTQSIGKEAFSFRKSPADIIAFSSHKIAGPQGVGALVVKEGTNWISPITGGGQEDGRRGGTQATLLISAFGLACELKKEEFSKTYSSLKDSFTRDFFEAQILANLENVEIIGHKKDRLNNTSMLIIKDVSAVDLIKKLQQEEIIISAGSACSKGGDSKVLKAMGFSERERRSAIRVSFDATHKIEDGKLVAMHIINQSKIIRELNNQEVENLLKS